MKNLFSNVILKLEAWIDRPWAVPGLALLAGIDLFVVMIPTEGILISSVMLRPKRWWSIALWLTTGSALGALAMALVIHQVGPFAVETFFENAMTSPGWIRIDQLVDRHGAEALTLIALSPFPQQPAVVLAALGKMSIFTIAGCIWLGRLPKYLLFAWLASHAPSVLLRWNWVRRATGRVVPHKTIPK